MVGTLNDNFLNKLLKDRSGSAERRRPRSAGWGGPPSRWLFLCTRNTLGTAPEAMKINFIIILVIFQLRSGKRLLQHLGGCQWKGFDLARVPRAAAALPRWWGGRGGPTASCGNRDSSWTLPVFVRTELTICTHTLLAKEGSVTKPGVKGGRGGEVGSRWRGAVKTREQSINPPQLLRSRVITPSSARLHRPQ